MSTYNEPRWLELSLWGYAAQTHRDFEIVIADDGSTGETGDVIDRMRDEADLDIRHVWHEDRGFRKCRILNLATVEASSDYLVFSDGDCMPRSDFLATHARLARPRRFVSGGRSNLPRAVGARLTPDDVKRGVVFDPDWWVRSVGTRPRPLLKLAPGSFSGVWLDRMTTTRPTWNGHNASGWKTDLLAVNGFDERLGYGGEDRELGERLRNLGVRPIQARHRAVTVHLDHDRGYVDPDVIRSNLEIRKRTTGVPRWLSRLDWIRRGPVETPCGIKQLADEHLVNAPRSV